MDRPAERVRNQAASFSLLEHLSGAVWIRPARHLQASADVEPNEARGALDAIQGPCDVAFE